VREKTGRVAQAGSETNSTDRGEMKHVCGKSRDSGKGVDLGGVDVRKPLETVNLDWCDDLEEIGMIKQTIALSWDSRIEAGGDSS
jgi:hypothetical protein